MTFEGGVKRKYLNVPTDQVKDPSRFENTLLLQLHEGWSRYCFALRVSHGGALGSQRPDQHFGGAEPTRFAIVLCLISWSSTTAGKRGLS